MIPPYVVVYKTYVEPCFLDSEGPCAFAAGPRDLPFTVRAVTLARPH